MRCADGVDVVPLHGHQVGDHRLHGDGVPRARVVLVPVDALEQDRLAVDAKRPVLNLHLAEADPAAHHLDRRAGRVAQRQQHGIQRRRLVRPQRRGRDPAAQFDLRLTAWADLSGLAQRFIEDHVARRVIKLHRHGVPLVRDRTQVPHLRLDDQRGVAVLRVQFRADPKVAYMHGGRGHQPHTAIDAAHPPEVLVFQIRTVGPAQHPHRQHVLARLQIGRDVELCRDAALLAVPNLLPVHPHRTRRIDALEVQEHLRTGPGRRHTEAPPVAAGRVVVLRDGGQVVNREGIADVGVNGDVVFGLAVQELVAQHLPAAWHGDAVPTRIVEVGRGEARRGRRRVGRPRKRPLAVQTLHKRRLVPVKPRLCIRGQGCLGVGKWDKRRPRRLFVAPDNQRITPLREISVHQKPSPLARMGNGVGRSTGLGP